MENVFTLKIDENNPDWGLMCNSFVNDPAVGYQKIAFNEQKMCFKNEVQQKFTSVSLLADTPIERSFGYMVFTKDVIAKLVNKFIIDGKSNLITYQHGEEIYPDVAYLVEHFIVDHNRVISPAYKDVPQGSWITTYYVPDKDIYNKLANDPEFNGFSVEVLSKIEPYIDNSKLNYIKQQLDNKDLDDTQIYESIKNLFK